MKLSFYQSTLIISALFCLVLSTLSTPAHGQDQTSEIYTDALASGWENFSWVSVDMQSTAVTHTGSQSIAVTYDAWQALYLHYPQFSTTGYTALRFFINGGSTGGQRIQLYTTSTVNGATVDGPKVTIPTATNDWMQLDVPLTDLGAADTTITGLTWMDITGGKQPTLYLDDIMLVNDVSPDAPSLSNGSTLPNAAPADGHTGVAVRVNVADSQGIDDVIRVTLDANSIGKGTIELHDDGQSNDGAAGDGTYGDVFTVTPGTPSGEQMLAVTAEDKAGHRTTYPLGFFVVLTTPGGNAPSVLPQHLGWGTNLWSLTPGEDWQVNSNVPWTYVNQYIDYNWYSDGWGGDFVKKFVQHAWNNHFVPVVSVYMMLSLPPTCGESAACYAQKLQNSDAVHTYLAALAEAAQQASGEAPVIFQIEPDFYGFMQDLSNSDARPAGVLPDDPSSYPVALNVDGYPNTLAGFGRRVVDVIHQTSPNLLVAPHVSMWGSHKDPNSVTADEALQMAQRSAKFVDAMGGDEADLFTVEWSDADAGSGRVPWWDDTDLQLPRPSRAILWENALSAATGKRLLLWQVPAGNTELDNTCNHYRDNRAAYAFHHSADLYNAGVIGVVFGGGNACMTSAATDGGFIASQAAIAYAQPDPPHNVAADVVNGSTVQLRWGSSTEPDVSGYKVMYESADGQSETIDVSQNTAVTLLMPTIGSWALRIAAYDSMGNLSSASSPVTITTTAAPRTTFLPIVTNLTYRSAS